MKKSLFNIWYIAGGVAAPAIALFFCINAYLLPPWATRIRAEMGDRDAQTHLAFMYHEGVRIQQDYSQALKWWKKCAAQGNFGCAYNIGIAYAQGEGVPKDEVTAAKWYRLSAEGGYDEGQNNLAGFYLKGSGGLPQDLKKAHEWYQKAADQGYELAIRNLKVVEDLEKSLIPLSDGRNGIDQALEDAGNNKFRFIYYEWISSAAPREHATWIYDGRMPRYSKLFDVLCDKELQFRSSGRPWAVPGDAVSKPLEDPYQSVGPSCIAAVSGLALNDVSPDIRQQQADYNATLALHPDFPLPHLCHVDPAADIGRIKAEILKRMHISEEEYAKRRQAQKSKSIFSAAYFGDVGAIKNDLKDVNAKDDLARTPIEYAVQGNQLEAFKFLLDHGVAPESKVGGSPMSEPWSPLVHAVLAPGKKDFFLALQKYNPKLSFSEIYGAAVMENFDLARDLINSGVPVSQKEFEELGSNIPYRNEASLPFLKFLAGKGVTVKALEADHPCQTTAGEGGHCQSTFLCNVAESGNVEALKFVLEQGNTPAAGGISPLSCAMRSPENYVELTALLLDAGASPYVDYGFPILGAVTDEKRKAELTKLFLSHKVDIRKISVSFVDPFILSMQDSRDPTLYDQKTFKRVLSPKDIENIKEAANDENGLAQYFLGRMYDEGNYVPQDKSQAYMWLTLAVTHSSAEPAAKSEREYLVGKMTNEQISEGDRLVKSWKPQAAPAP